VNYWEVIADKLSKAGWSWGCVATGDFNGRTIWMVGAHRDRKRFVVRADEILTAFLDLTRQNTTAISQKMISSAFRDRRYLKNEN
jgi:hypothetical protein